MTSSPRITALLLACNQAATVRAAAQSVLAQACEPLEVILSDDASSDGTFAVLEDVARAYRGPHAVRARRNESNLGIGGHYNRLIAESRGELLVTAGGDDLSSPSRVAKLAEAWDATGRRADLVSSHFVELLDDGAPGRVVATDDLAQVTLARWLVHRPYIVGATHAFTRRTMARFGPFIDGLWYEDQVMTFRAVVGGGGVTVTEPLVQYRRGGSSQWSKQPSGSSLLHWTGVQNRRLLAEFAQLSLDAGIAGCREAVDQTLAPMLRRERFLEKLVNASTHGERWHALRAASALPLGWRVGKVLRFVFPDQAAAIRLRRLKRKTN
jgi:glycosyltransferase involved in cell wall biosynthesis